MGNDLLYGQWPHVGEGCFVWAMASCRGGMFCMGNGLV